MDAAATSAGKSTSAGEESEVLLEARDVRKYYPIRGGVFARKQGDVKAVDGVSFKVRRGETLGLVGESGCGKSTLGRTIIRLEEASSGTVLYKGKDLLDVTGEELFALRSDVQMIFQDPYSSLNPRLPVGEIVREPLDVHKVGTRAERYDRVIKLFNSVGLKEEVLDRYPHEFSGGQRQRVGIARALALDPDIIIADEPVSALDVSVQAQVINLMVEIQQRLNLTYIFISHDLSVVEYISDSIAIMYLGRIVEQGKKETIFARPGHPYTRALIDSVPDPNPRKRRDHTPIEGEIPSPVNPPPGCPFHPRCPYAIEQCSQVVPTLEPRSAEDDPTHVVSCIRRDEI